jgi:dual specificity phosphatase 10
LLKEGITHIINLTKNLPFYHENSKRIKIEYLRIQVNDGFVYDNKKYFDETNKFIDKVKQQNGKVLVHCQAGIFRSPEIVIKYLMKEEKSGYETVFNNVKAIRKNIMSIIPFVNNKNYEKASATVIGTVHFLY